jgi:hypothetical protein
MDLKKLPLAERIMSLAALLLALDLFILPWHRISIGLGAFGSVTASRSGVESPDGFIGILAALLALAIVARIVLTEFTSVELPTLPLPWPRADLIAGAALAALVVLKLLADTSFLSIGAWLAVPLAGAVAYGGYLGSRDVAPSAAPTPAGPPEPNPTTP